MAHGSQFPPARGTNASQYAPALEQTRYGNQAQLEAEITSQMKQRRVADDAGSVGSFGSTFGLLKEKFKSKSKSTRQSRAQRESDPTVYPPGLLYQSRA